MTAVMRDEDVEVPHSLEAERAILGAILISADQLALASQRLTAVDFYRQAHRVLWSAIEDVHRETQAVDLITLKDVLNRTGRLDFVGGAAYIASLTDGLPRGVNVEHYAEVVMAHADRRRLQRVCQESARSIASQADPVAAVSTLVEQAREAVRSAGLRRTAVGLTESLAALMGELDDPPHVATTGLPSLDALGAGFRSGELTLLSGRPSAGKTALALHMAREVARGGHRVWFASLEMRHTALSMRLLAAEADVDFGRLRGAQLSQTEFEHVRWGREALTKLPIEIDDSPGIDLDALRRMVLGQQGLLIVDYIQLLKPPRDARKYGNRVLEVGALSRGLKAIAHDSGVSVLALSQLSRSVEQRGRGSEPVLSDLRDSGELEQDADVVLMCWRPHTLDDAQPDDLTYCKVAKNRNGPVGTVALTFCGARQKFAEREMPAVLPADQAVTRARGRW